MSINSTVTLNNGVEMPLLGLGVWKSKEGPETVNAVKWALEAGYRSVDTAQFYANEKSVGIGVKESGIKREEVFVTSKLAISNFGYDQALKAFDESLDKLGFDYLDLFLLHFPVNELRIESYKALERLYKDGKVRAIGVSNFTAKHIQELIEQCEVVPAVNQVEFHPYLYQKELHEYCIGKNIHLEAYSPLTKGEKFDDPKLVEISSKYKKSPAQIMIKWALQHEIIVIPKSSNENRIKENADIFDFEISKEDMKLMDNLNEDLRLSWNPESDSQVKTFSNIILRKASGLTH